MVLEALGLLLFPCFFPCLVIGIIMLISLLTCDYIEKFVKSTFCPTGSRRRRYRETEATSRDPPGGNNGLRGPKTRREHETESLLESHRGVIIRSVGTATLSQPRLEPPQATYYVTPGSSRSGVVQEIASPEYDEPPPYHECVKINSSSGSQQSVNKKID